VDVPFKLVAEGGGAGWEAGGGLLLAALSSDLKIPFLDILSIPYRNRSEPSNYSLIYSYH
jgi:hypothetical protein